MEVFRIIGIRVYKKYRYLILLLGMVFASAGADAVPADEID